MVSVSAETENAVSAAVSVTAVTEKSDFGRSLLLDTKVTTEKMAS